MIKNLFENFMPKPKDYKSYMREYKKIYVKRLQITIFITLFLSFLGYSLAYFSYKEQFSNLSKILIVWQILTIPLLLISYNKRMFLKYRIIVKYILIALTIFALCSMVYITGGSVSPYYAGIILLIIGPAQMIPYTSKEAVIEYFLIFSCYIIIVLLPNNTPFNSDMFFNNLYFMILASFVGINGAYQLSKHRITEFNQRYELKEIDRIKTEYYAKVNHEIRTPLAMIVSPIEKLINEKDELSEKEKGYLLNVARNNSLRLFGLANDLLEMVRLDQAMSGKRFQLVDLSMVVDGIIESVEYMFKRQGHDFNYMKSKSPIIIKGNYNAIEKILINLLSNSSKFTPKGGHIVVKVGNDNKNAFILVRDTGIGIYQERQADIFENFKRATETSQGLGLGLAIAKKLAEEMGGTIEVVSEANAGSDFIVIFPLVNQDKPDYQGEPDVKDNSLLTNISGKADAFKIIAAKELKEIIRDKKPDYKMLIIDDEPDMNDYLAHIFKDEYKLIRTVNATQGIEEALKETPDIILLDLMLPDLNGIEACKKLREEKSLADAKIIVLTARGDERFRIDAIAAGANDFIGKPFSDIEIRIRTSSMKKDIKRRKELQETLKRLKTTLKELKNAQVRLVRDEKLKTLGVLSAGILHEMSNHLNYPRLYSYQLQNDLKDNPKLKKKADSIYAGVVRIEDIMTGLRQFASGSKTYASYFAFNEVLKQAKNIIKKQAEGIEIKNRIQKEYKVFGVATEILNLLLNLFINSIDALEESGKKLPTIEISALEKDKRLYISFKDNGCGIAEKDINNIFEAFYTTKTSEKGMGLGLSIIEATIKRHKGEIKVNSKQGEFTEFIFDLPLQP